MLNPRTIIPMRRLLVFIATMVEPSDRRGKF